MMPDDIAAQASHDGEKVNVQTMPSYHSVWMAHWMHASYKSATPSSNRLTIDCEPKEVKDESDAEKRDLLGGLEGNGSTQAGAFVEADRATRVPSINEIDARKSKEASVGSESVPLFNLSRKLDGRLSLQREHDVVFHGEDGKSENVACSGDDNEYLNRARSCLPSTSEHAPPEKETLVREFQILSQGVFPSTQLMKSPCAVEEKNPAVSTSQCNDFVKSDSEIVPNGRDKGKTVMSRFVCGPREIYQSSYNLASQECFGSTKYHSYSSLLIREKNMSRLLDLQRSSFSRWMQGSVAYLPHDPIVGSDDGVYFVCGQHHVFEDYTANANIRNQTASSESTKPKHFYGVSSALPQVPCSAHDVATMKLYNSIGSVEESSRGHPKISQTTHHFLMSKKTDGNSSDRSQFFRQSIAPTKIKGNSSNEILDLSPRTSDSPLEGRKLEALESSINSEGKENALNFKFATSLKNESSAETDTMDIDALRGNNLPSDVSLHTNRRSKDSQNSLTSQVATTSAREKTVAKSVNTVLPDINQDPNGLLSQASPLVDRETSTSRTHSLDVEHLFSNADELARSKSGSSSLGPDPSSRWVKRLKLCTLGSSHGMESVKIGETSSREKENNIFSKTMEHNKTSLEPKMGYPAEGQEVSDLPTTALMNDKSAFTEAKKTVEITLSHPWIQRWSHDRAESSQKRNELAELREPPKSSNILLEDFQKKQFPSIAAMALMGKAMKSLNHSELMKKGPIIVWNTKGF